MLTTILPVTTCAVVICLQQMRQLETKVGEQTSVMSELRAELERVRRVSADAVAEQTRLQKELDSAKASVQDLERSERLVRVDLEKASKRVMLTAVTISKNIDVFVAFRS